MRYSYLPPRFVCLLFFSVFWVAPTVLAQEEARTWKLIDAEGIKGTISSFRDSQVTIRTEDGSKTVALDQLEPKDRKRALASRLGSGVVLLTASDAYRRPMSFGSGFIVSNEDKTIITNFHVVERAAEIAVAFRDGEVKSRVERCVAVDSANDLVLLQLDKMPFGLHEFQIADSANVEQGDEAWTIGHPQGLKDTVSWGEINAVRKTKDLPRQLAAMFPPFILLY